MTQYRKKLIEVALPLDDINEASAYDKMPGIGPHPKGLHKWWAPLPLPAARAVILASLFDDPSESPQLFPGDEAQRVERDRLFALIRASLAARSPSFDKAVNDARREIVKACDGAIPTLVDPFAGSGAIPLEAYRLNLPVAASDLNPVAVMMNRCEICVPQPFAGLPPVNPVASRSLAKGAASGGLTGLAEDLRFYAGRVLERVQSAVGHVYDGDVEQGPVDRTQLLAWIWTRTVACPNPACGRAAPLVRSFQLSTKSAGKSWIEPEVDGSTVRFLVRTGVGTPPPGTMTRQGAKCIFCGADIPLQHIRVEGRAGRLGARLMATVRKGARKRVYVSADEAHERRALAIAKPAGVLDIDLPEKGLGFRVQSYGFTKHRDLYTNRQLTVLDHLCSTIDGVIDEVLADATRAGMDAASPGLEAQGAGAKAYSEAIRLYLALALDRCVDFNNAFCRWVPTNEKVMNLFARAAVPMVWDYAEANLLGDGVGAWKTCSDYVADCLGTLPANSSAAASATQLDASTLPVRSGVLVSTDPPYYDNIGYADLSDILYVWLRRLAKTVYPDLCSTLLVPKAQELIADASRQGGDAAKAAESFQAGFKKTFAGLKAQMDGRFPLTVYYAFKQAESETSVGSASATQSEATGWSTMLDSLVSSGFQVTGTWPIRASQSSRIRSLGSNALASYVVLVCRPRPQDASLSTRKELLAALRAELPGPVRRLQEAGVAPVDLAQAAVGPGMGVFSRYSRVLEPDGSDMRVGTALGLINQVLDEALTEQESEFDEDTRWAIAWFEQRGFSPGPFGDAENMCRAKNTSVQGMVEAGIIDAGAGKVHLLRRDEIDEAWDPSTDKRLTVWEMTQHLLRLLDAGEAAAAALARRLGGNAEVARDLAYRLYLVCERKKWSEEGQAYNALVVAWPQIQRLAASQPAAAGPSQTSFEV